MFGVKASRLLTIAVSYDIIDIYLLIESNITMPKESYWKLLSEKYFEWKNGTDQFFQLQERIRKDSRAIVFDLPGRSVRNDMHMNITALLNNGVITLDDLSES